MAKLTSCKDCGHTISKNANACPSCGAKVKRISILTWIAAIFIGFMVLSAIIGGISGGKSESETAAEVATITNNPANSTNETKKELLSEMPETTSRWSYDESVDEMRGETSYFTGNTSLNTAELNFPYGPGVELNIIIRDDAKNGQDILFAVNKGQLFCSYQDCYVSVKFDDGPVQKIATTEAAAGSSEVLFLAEDISGFVDKLKKADNLMVEVNFYDHGNEQFKFDVSGLEWSRF